MSETVRRWSDEGVRVPLVREQPEGKPSYTLTAMYVALAAVAGSLLWSHLDPSRIVATCVTLIFWLIAMTFYRMRAITKLKVDLDDREVELEGESEEPKKER